MKTILITGGTVLVGYALQSIQQKYSKYTYVFLSSKDLADLMMWVLENYKEKDSIILSVGEKDEISIRYIATLIAKNYDYEHMMEFDDSFSDGQFKKTADNSKLMKLHPDFQFTTVETGIKKSVEWFQTNFDKCRK